MRTHAETIWFRRLPTCWIRKRCMIPSREGLEVRQKAAHIVEVQDKLEVPFHPLFRVSHGLVARQIRGVSPTLQEEYLSNLANPKQIVKRGTLGQAACCATSSVDAVCIHGSRVHPRKLHACRGHPRSTTFVQHPPSIHPTSTEHSTLAAYAKHPPSRGMHATPRATTYRTYRAYTECEHLSHTGPSPRAITHLGSGVFLEDACVKNQRGGYVCTAVRDESLYG